MRGVSFLRGAVLAVLKASRVMRGVFLYHFIVDIFMTINTLQDFTLYETQHTFA